MWASGMIDLMSRKELREKSADPEVQLQLDILEVSLDELKNGEDGEIS